MGNGGYLKLWRMVRNLGREGDGFDSGEDVIEEEE